MSHADSHNARPFCCPFPLLLPPSFLKPISAHLTQYPMGTSNFTFDLWYLSILNCPGEEKQAVFTTVCCLVLRSVHTKHTNGTFSHSYACACRGWGVTDEGWVSCGERIILRMAHGQTRTTKSTLIMRSLRLHVTDEARKSYRSMSYEVTCPVSNPLEQ